MPDPVANYPYETRLNILHEPLEIIDEKALADACEFKWFNQTLCKVNDSVVRMAVIEGEYHWHKHDEDDEFFTWSRANYSSTLKAVPWNSRRAKVSLSPGESCTVPAPHAGL